MISAGSNTSISVSSVRRSSTDPFARTKSFASARRPACIRSSSGNATNRTVRVCIVGEHFESVPQGSQGERGDIAVERVSMSPPLVSTSDQMDQVTTTRCRPGGGYDSKSSNATGISAYGVGSAVRTDNFTSTTSSRAARAAPTIQAISRRSADRVTRSLRLSGVLALHTLYIICYNYRYLMDRCPTCNQPDPGDGLFCRHCTTHLPGATFQSTFKPSWGVFERAMQSDDSKTQRAATDLFLTERARETAVSGKAARWEKGRRANWAKDKPTWRKRQQIDA